MEHAVKRLSPKGDGPYKGICVRCGHVFTDLNDTFKVPCNPDAKLTKEEALIGFIKGDDL